LQLLVIPLVLVGIGFAFDLRQQGIEDQRAERERQLEEQRAQDATLHGYLDQMSQLLLEKDLRESEQGSEVRTLARAQTLTVLEGVDPSRRTQVLRFLIEAELVQRVDEQDPAMSLRQANLQGVSLFEPELYGANLSDANLREADLYLADLRLAHMNGADLRLAAMHSANLSDATLSDANLSGAVLSGANLSGANLNGANLSKTVLIDTSLSGADLSEAFLGGANVTQEQLDQAASLEGTVMPNGQEYEYWLKDKEAGGEEGENGGPS
jgi:uncharacterized protein YjbI with pentapeptide repeats